MARNFDRAHDSRDVVLVGGGLANCCIALALERFHPELRVTLVESNAQILGNHTWCFHEQDLGARVWSLLQPAVERVWPGYEVSFPDRQRHVSSAYGVITSERLRAVVERALHVGPGCELVVNDSVANIEPHRVVLESGRELSAAWVVDARGPKVEESSPDSPPTLFQKFLGLELRLAESAPREIPLLMDATVPQLDGFRFMYILPLEPRRMLIEDTYFSDSSALDEGALRERILSYAQAKGYLVEAVIRQEVGVLPMPCRGRAYPEPGSPLRLGYAGGWFHPTTGYSLPLASRVAEVFTLKVDEWRTRLDDLRRLQANQFRFGAFLNRLLQEGFSPEKRWNAFSRFYGFDDRLIARFYALKMTHTDRLRLLCGRPPRGLSLKHWQLGMNP